MFLFLSAPQLRKTDQHKRMNTYRTEAECRTDTLALTQTQAQTQEYNDIEYSSITITYPSPYSSNPHVQCIGHSRLLQLSSARTKDEDPAINMRNSSPFCPFLLRSWQTFLFIQG